MEDQKIFDELLEKYLLFRAAKYLNIEPWKLEKKSSKWKNWALCFDFAEDKAEEIKNARNPLNPLNPLAGK